MIIHQVEQQNLWWAESSYHEKDILKLNGWWWHGGYNCSSSCRACKAKLGRVWYTPKLDSALALVDVADGPTRERLLGNQAKAEESLSASMATEASRYFQPPAPKGKTYYPFQLAGIEFATKRKHTLLADEMGLGKTIQALGLINADRSIKKVLVICPASLKLNWEREANEWLTRPFKIHVCNKPKPDMTADMIVVNYERARKLDTARYLMREWDLLIIDESHKLKNPKALQTKRILGTNSKRDNALFAYAKKSIFLTGTPILNRPIELWPTLSALAPSTFPSFFPYAKRYCGAKQQKYGATSHWDFSGATNLNELQTALRSSIMIRRNKEEVLSELPEKHRSILPLPVGASTKTLLLQEQTLLRDAHIDDRMDWEEAVQTLRGHSVAFERISRLRHDLAVAKLPLVIERVGEILSEQSKIVVFAHHREVVESIQEAFGDSAVKLYGGMKDTEKQEAIDRFQNDPTCNIFVGSILASGVGITLTAANIALFAELDWVPANVFQAEDRLHRIGQRKHVLIQYMVFNHSLEARIAKAMLHKQHIANAVLNMTEE